MNRKERNDLAALDTTGIEIFCSKCGVRLGRVVDKTYLVIENTRFWHTVSFTCTCGKPIYFKPNEPKDLHSVKGVAQEILMALGKDRKVGGH
jgi:peptide methionine sulfoxide reductase MsrB